MDCLECATTLAMKRNAVGCCVYCGAGVCLDHARLVAVYARPSGLVPPSRSGARRVICATCYAAPDGGESSGSAGAASRRPRWAVT